MDNVGSERIVDEGDLEARLIWAGLLGGRGKRRWQRGKGFAGERRGVRSVWVVARVRRVHGTWHAMNEGEAARWDGEDADRVSRW